MGSNNKPSILDEASSVAEAAGTAAGVLAFLVIGPLAFGFSLMMAFGVVHHMVTADFPTIGYFPAVLLALLIRLTLYVRTGGE